MFISTTAKQLVGSALQFVLIFIYLKPAQVKQKVNDTKQTNKNGDVQLWKGAERSKTYEIQKKSTAYKYTKLNG